jgi:allophanate hydrolase
MIRHTPRFPQLTLAGLREAYAGERQPADILCEIYRRIAERGNDAVWIHLAPLDELLNSLPSNRSLPLFGIPFAVKDNIDVAGWPTTAGCKEYRYMARTDATVVARLRAAGAIPIGKTNLDQFATGLVGTRSPYGKPRCIFDDRYVSGGSSSGSAVAVAAGLAAFSLGTDTAGSGRVPAAFNSIVGLKPTRGLVSTAGVVPACRSLDCVSIFSSSVPDAKAILGIAQGFDDSDLFSRPKPDLSSSQKKCPIRVGVPQRDLLEFFGDDEAKQLYFSAVEGCQTIGHEQVEIDFTPFRDTARLLYSGPWVAERLAAIQPFFQDNAPAMDPVVREIIGGAARLTAVETFRGIYELERLKQKAAQQWEKMDVLLLPTTGTTYTVDAITADPVRLNSNLGYYTNFANLLDLCGIAAPAGFRKTNGLPFGVTYLARAFQDEFVCEFATGLMTANLPSH